MSTKCQSSHQHNNLSKLTLGITEQAPKINDKIMESQTTAKDERILRYFLVQHRHFRDMKTQTMRV